MKVNEQLAFTIIYVYIYRVYQKKLRSWKKFTKVRCARHLQKLSVSLCTLTFSGTSIYIVLKLVFGVGKLLLIPPPLQKKALRKKRFHWNQNLIQQSQNIWAVLHKLYTIKVSRN